MISNLEQTTLVFVEEAQAHAIGLGAGDNDVVTDIPSIHATRIDVLVNATVAGDLKIKVYGASKVLSLTTTLGAVAAATTTGFTFGGVANAAVGQVYDLIFTPSVAPGAGETVTLWTAART